MKKVYFRSCWKKY